MKKLTILFFVLMSLSIIAQEKPQTSSITDDLASYLDQRSDDLIRINIRLKDKYNTQSLKSELSLLDRAQRRELVKSELKTFSQNSQTDLLNYLENKSNYNEAKVIHRFWITNVITCMVSEEVIYELALRSDIDRIDIDEERNLLMNVPASPGTAMGVDEITYNVLKVNAPDVWALGFTGEGVVVSVIDTGVNYDHDDLQDHMWEDPSFPNHGWDFYNNDDDPMDGHSHGTHCAGTVAGDGTAGSQTGIAPNASIMALKVLADGGDATESGVWQAIEFTVDHGGDVISMSLGWAHSWNPDRTTWRNTMDNALAAGVIASVAAGNEDGSINNPDDVRTPGDCPPPWLNPDQTLIGGISAVVCIGATDSNDDIAYFSSLGPSEWESIDPYFDYPFNPEIGLIRPDVSAPGVDIKSCDAFNTSGYSYKSGTSMATPCVAGVMALLLSKNNNLTPEDITIVLETTAIELGTPGKDNVFGSGRVDALEAIDNTSYAGPIYNSYSISDDNGNGEIESGESVLLSIEMYNGSESPYTGVDVSVSSQSEYVSITDNFETYGNFAVGEYKSITDGFAFDVVESTPGTKTIRFDVEATDGNETWTSYFNMVTYGPNLEFGNLVVDDVAQGNGNGRLDPGETADLVMTVHNYGQDDASNVEVNLAITSELVTLENTQHLIPLVVSEGSDFAVFTVIVSDEAPVGSAVTCDFDLQSGVFSNVKSTVLKIGLIVEDWESSSFDQFNWTFDDNADWIISSENPYEGEYCSQSGVITHLQSSSLILTYDVETDDSISFYKEVSSEASYDFLKFYIDGTKMDEWAGEVAWSRSVFPVNTGIHTFKWEYYKDQSVSNGDDRARIDFVLLPPGLMPTVNAGDDAIICNNETYNTEAIAENYNSLEWTTSGDGTFDDANIIDPVYAPGTYDIEAGTSTLTLTAYGNNGDVSNSMVLEIISAPESPATPIGETSLCADPGKSVYTTEFFEGYAYEWILEPLTAGDFESDSSSVIVSWNAEFTGVASIKVKAINQCGESEFSEMLTIDVHNSPEVNLGDDTEVCIGTYATLDAGNEGSLYLWSTGETTQIIDVDTTDMDNNNNRTVSVLVTDQNSCSSNDEIVVHFLDCSGISENNYLNGFEIFPNPNSGIFTIKLNSLKDQEVIIELISSMGKIVYTEKLQINKGQFSKKLNVQYLSNQLYYLRINSKDGILSKKLIIE